MQLSESKLKQIIKEELQKVLVTEFTDDGRVELDIEKPQNKIDSAIGELYSPKELMKAVGASLRAILGLAGVSNVGGLIDKYDKRDPLRREFRDLYNLRRKLRRGRKVDMTALLNNLGPDSTLATALGIEAPGKQGPGLQKLPKDLSSAALTQYIVRQKKKKFTSGELDAAAKQMANLRKAPSKREVASDPTKGAKPLN